MTLFDYYLQYMTQICEGSLTAPEGITLTQTDEMHRAMELQRQIGAMGIPAFVRACAAAAGDEIPQAAYDNFSMDDVLSAAQALADLIAPSDLSETNIIPSVFDKRVAPAVAAAVAEAARRTGCARV